MIEMIKMVETYLGRKPVSVEEINDILDSLVDKPVGGLVLTKVGKDTNGEDLFRIVRADT